MKPDLTTYLGRTVAVEIDRPLGSRHPQHHSLIYPVNYGELPGTVSGDDHPIDAYVLGPTTPVDRVDGLVIAVVIRDDDNEDKLVVTMGVEAPTAETIWRAISFQEQYFRSRIILAENHDTSARRDRDTV